MRAGAALLSIVLGACSFDGTAGTTDGGATRDGDVAAVDAVSPDAAPLGPWETPTLVVELNSTASDDDPALTADMLEIFFASQRGDGDEDVWTSTRPTLVAPWGKPMRVDILSSPSSESNIKLSADGLLITFASNRAPSQQSDLWAAERASRADPWPAPTRVAELSSPDGEWHAHPSPDHLRVILCSNRDGDEDLWIATRAAAGAAWGMPAHVPELADAAADCDPMEPDATHVYFASTRAGGAGGYDFYTATRDSATYGAPVPITELNTPGNDRDPWVSPDGRTMYFTTDDSGDNELYVTQR